MNRGMGNFVHERHKPPLTLARPRELVVACAPMRSNVNLSRIMRTAGCCGVPRLICCGNAKIIDKIARDSVDDDNPAAVAIQVHRTLLPALKELKQDGHRLVGLEQTTGSRSLYDFRFERRSVLIVGNERLGLDEEVLRLVDDVVEIPVYGLPYAYNVATAAAMALYEYCKQYPQG
jgi:tRNA G18 (ribose-2'-O)-methylase SpoU